MESNSIKDNLSKEDMISDILLCLGADIHRENIYWWKGKTILSFCDHF